jgi:hypothetical protein
VSITDRPREMMRWLVRDLDSAIMFYEAARPLWLDRRIADRFHLTEAGNTAAALRFAAELQAAMAVLRMWDQGKQGNRGKKEDNTASLIGLMRELSTMAVQDALVAEATARVEHHYGPAVRSDIEPEIVRWCRAIGVTEMRYRPNLDRLRAYRNKRLAHRNPFDLDGLSLAGTAGRGDIATMLAAARRIVRGLRACMDGEVYRPRDSQQLRRRYSEAFWTIPLRTPRHEDD